MVLRRGHFCYIEDTIFVYIAKNLPIATNNNFIMYTKMTASMRGFQKCIISRGYLSPCWRFSTISHQKVKFQTAFCKRDPRREVDFYKWYDLVDIYTKMTASMRGFQKCILSRGYLSPCGRFSTI